MIKKGLALLLNKFRGLDNKTKQFVYGFLMQDSLSLTIITNNAPPETFCRVETNSVGQFIGLLDKNKTEIYTGDILKNNFGELFLCGYGKEEASFYLLDNVLRTHYFKDDSDEYEVMGNEIQNPNLFNTY